MSKIEKKNISQLKLSTALMCVGMLGTSLIASATQAGEPKVLWGDTHLHTSRSFDAFMSGNVNVNPDVAYRFAKGQPVLEPMSGTRVQLSRPLDFLVVADHAELMDVPRMMMEGNKILTSSPIGKKMSDLMRAGKGHEAFQILLTGANKGDNTVMNALSNVKMRQASWHEVVDNADKHNEPGKFTAFSGWEWSSIPDGANLHRVVFTPNSGEVAKSFIPHSSMDSGKPEDLWAWLDKTSAENAIDFIAIPHNSNISKGKMFDTVDSNGRPLTAEYARTRAKWEPVVEASQIKGDSETHPMLSPNDEFADFEQFKFLLDVRNPEGTPATATDGDYVRGALKRGLEFDQKLGINPYKFGLIGSTDAHTSFASVEEDSFLGKLTSDTRLADKQKGIANTPFITGWGMSASGLAAVWAEENTREAITAAFKRKEVYATTGSRIMLRMFGSFRFKNGDQKPSKISKVGYKKGVPMGGDLSHAPKGKSPRFIVQALKDPLAVNLDRIQIIKGWLDENNQAQEKVFNISWSGERTIGKDGKLPAVATSVDLKTAYHDNSFGAAELTAYWLDPEFDPTVRAFYYVRVLEVPRPRHSSLDSVALGLDPKDAHPQPSIQDRAYSSPIWYTP